LKKIEYSDLDWENPDIVIKFYESNYQSITIKEYINNKEDVVQLLNVKLQYINSLTKNRNYLKALRYSNEIKEFLNKHDSEQYYRNFCTENDYYSGVIQGGLQNYKTSIRIFSNLSKKDPDNVVYNNWYRQMRVNYITKNIKYLNYLGGFIVLLSITLDFGFNIDLDNWVLLLGLFSFICSWIIPKIIKK
tara:strand:+ start:246 stop:815 length:570 start_codon:yes stop_codon:yes gene_type:complete